jgi:hypothetical protein
VAVPACEPYIRVGVHPMVMLIADICGAVCFAFVAEERDYPFSGCALFIRFGVSTRNRHVRHPTSRTPHPRAGLGRHPL